MRYSFTITCLRAPNDILKNRELLENKIFQGIEIFYPYNLDENGKKNYTKAIKELVKGLDIEIVLHLPHGGYDNDLCRNDETVIKRFLDAIDYGRLFNVKKYTLHLGSTSLHTQDEYLNISINNVKRLCEYANNENIMIENMPSNTEVASNLYEMKYIIEHVNMSNCKLIYDTGHGHVSLKDIEEEKNFLRALKPYLYHIHISDNDSTCDKHAPIGQGNIAFKDLFSVIINEYKELYCLEILYKDYNDLKKYHDDLINVLNS